MCILFHTYFQVEIEGSSHYELIEISCRGDLGGVIVKVREKHVISKMYFSLILGGGSLIMQMCARSNIFLHFSNIKAISLLLHQDFVFQHQYFLSFINTTYFLFYSVFI